MPISLQSARRFIMQHSHDTGRFPMGPKLKPLWSSETRAQWDEAWQVVREEVARQNGLAFAEWRKREERRQAQAQAA